MRATPSIRLLSPERKLWLLLPGAVLLIPSPIFCLLLAHALEEAGLPLLLAWMPIVVVSFGIGWWSHTSWWILTAGLAPLPLALPFVGLSIGPSEATPEFWLGVGIGLLIVAAIAAVPAALSTWLGRR